MGSTEDNLRKWCIEMAIEIQRVNPIPDIISNAQKIYDWVRLDTVKPPAKVDNG